MGLFDCVASPEGQDSFEGKDGKPIYKPRELSRSDHDISRRRALPLFASQSSLKNVRDVDFWRQRVVRFLFSPESREDVRVLRVPLHLLGYDSITDFIGAIPAEIFEEYQNQPPPDEGLLKDYKVFWVRDGIAEPGAFKWTGTIEDHACVGLQLDRKKGVPFGTYDGKGLFYCKPGHRALVPEYEVIPYKKFLRRFLGIPPRKDSIIGSSVRLSAKAIAAKNSKPGDKIYLPKEKKYAIVQWVGKIEGETVVDIIYEPLKPEAGMPVSPDEPCISRSFSMADFIDEVGASEPNTPITVQPQQEPTKIEETSAPTKPLPPSPPPHSSDESDESDVSTSDDDDESDEDESGTDEDDSEVEAEVVRPEPESEESSSEESLHRDSAPSSKRSSLHEGSLQNSKRPSLHEGSLQNSKRPSLHEGSLQNSKRPSLQATNELQVLQNDVQDEDEIQMISPALPSPKRKGFFRFSPNKKRSKSPRPVTPVFDEPDIIESMPLHVEPEREQSPELRPAKSSSSIFSSLRFKKSKKPPKNVETVELEEAEQMQVTKTKKKSKLEWPKKSTKDVETLESEEIEPKQLEKKKTKSEWSIIFFKSRSKSPVENLRLTQSSPMECTTPIDEMVPPDKIPTPPPQTEEFNERQIDRPEFLPLPVEQSRDENRKKYLGKRVEPPVVPEKSSGISSHQLQEVSLSPKDSSSESESSESDEELGAGGGQQVAAMIETHVPPEPAVPDDEHQLVNKQELNTPSESDSDKSELESSDDEDVLEVKVSSPQVSEESVEPFTEKIEQPPTPTYPSASIDKFKESKIRNRPSSFGSFLARIKNQTQRPVKMQASHHNPTLVPTSLLQEALPVIANDNVDSVDSGSPILAHQVQDTKPEQEVVPTPHAEGYKMLTDSESSLSDAAVQDEAIDEPKVVAQIKKSVVKPSLTIEGDQEGIVLDLLDVDEPTPPFVSPPPVPTEESPKRKPNWNRSFSFSFSKKRKPSHPQSPTTPTHPAVQDNRDSDKENEEHGENLESSNGQPNQELHEEKEKERKPSKASSFRNSFRRTFSLTKKRPTTASIDDSDGESVKSPTSSINRPRPVTLYFDNNDVAQLKQSFRNKRPASVVVDVQPWSNRHGRDENDVYTSPNSEDISTSPSKSPNPALEPKQPEPEIPKHRIFTTPSIFFRKNKKTEEQPLTPKPKHSLYKKFGSGDADIETKQQPQPELQTPISDISSPSNDQPPPLPTTTPPPIIEPVKALTNFPFTESQDSIDSTSPKLKSALKQRKEIDSIPKGLKVNDRVMWYSGKEPIPGTVQRLFKDGTDKYTAMVKFDREVSNEPLRLTREGDAYMITVEELITPDMFGPAIHTQNDTTPAQSIIQAPQSPMTPSVRFDNIENELQQIPQVTITETNDELDLPPPFQEEEVNMACGFRRGIQCRDRSCCLETVLFSLFYTSNAFDIAMLYGNSPEEDSLTRNVRTILRREIIDPLRREGFCAWPAIKKIRDAVKPLSDEWQTLSTDAEVMMFILFDRALKLGKFISYSNDMSDYLHQLVVDTKDLSKSTTVQHLFETSLQLMDKLKLKTIPTPALIMEMPRSNDKLVQYKAVIPNLSLHISRVLDDGSRLCICGVVAKYECRKCSASFGSRSIVFCDNCKGTADIIHFQLTHQAELISLNQPIIIMDLAAILCVKQGHYSSFVKCGNEKFSPWVYFDGGEAENPKVCIEQNLGMWLDRLEKYPGKYHDALQYPLLTHILQDSHICVYQPREKSSSV